LEKLDKLLEQNKTIAKGLSLMEERLPQSAGQIPSQPTSQQIEELQEEYTPSIEPRPLPKF